jgi:uncharacterized protein (TIGR03437 family)
MGLDINGASVISADGTIQGVLQGPGQFAFTLSVTDSGDKNNLPVTLTQGYRLTVLPGLNAVLNSASYAQPPTTGDGTQGAVAPGEILALFGSGLGPATLTVSSHGATEKVPTQVAGTRVLFDGIAAPLLYTSAGQVSAIAPYEIEEKQSTQIQVEFNGLLSSKFQAQVVQSALGIFTSGGSGFGQVAALNADFSVNSGGNPVQKGDIVAFWATGEGQTNPPGQTGGVVPGDVLPVPKLPVSVFIDGLPCEILYSGETPTVPSGLLQLNVRIPAAARSGPDVPVYIVSNGVNSQAGTTISLK